MSTDRIESILSDFAAQIRAEVQRQAVAALTTSLGPDDVVRVSRKPILYGSEIDDLKVEQRKACVHWKANVVFPGGAVARDGYWLLSVGVNDSACVIAKVKPETLNL